jgi:hypothetical protein
VVVGVVVEVVVGAAVVVVLVVVGGLVQLRHLVRMQSQG